MIYELLGAETNLTVSTVSTEGDDPDADDPKVEDPEVDIVLIESERESCFHIAVFWSSDGFENSECVCAQQVLYRTTEDSPDVARLDAGAAGMGYQEECVFYCSSIMAQLISRFLSDTISNTV
jgi:hypothetical protein